MNRCLFTSNSDEYATPDEIYNELNSEFNFNLDPCSTDENHKCDAYFTKSDNGLQKSWGGVYSILQSAIQQYKRMGKKVVAGN